MSTGRIRRALLLGMLMILASSAAMAVNDVVAVVTGQTQGAIEGSYVFQGSDVVQVLEYHHLMLSGDGRPPSGNVDSQEVIFTKRADRATVNLWEAYDTDEALTVRFEHWLDCGTLLRVHQVELNGAKIWAIEPAWSDGESSVTERIRLRFQQMTVTNTELDSGCSTGSSDHVTIMGSLAE